MCCDPQDPMFGSVNGFFHDDEQTRPNDDALAVDTIVPAGPAPYHGTPFVRFLWILCDVSEQRWQFPEPHESAGKTMRQTGTESDEESGEDGDGRYYNRNFAFEETIRRLQQLSNVKQC